jgi:hypothetical protein
MQTSATLKDTIRDKVEGKLVPAHDELGHHYRFVEDDTIVDSVTTKMIIDKPHLAKWSGRMAAEYVIQHRNQIDTNAEEVIRLASLAHEDIRDTAGDIGTRAHDVIEKYVLQWLTTAEKPKNILTHCDPFDEPQVKSAVRAAERFFNEYQLILPIASELLVGDKELGVAGTLDLLALEGDKVCVVDWKTSNAVNDDYAIQVAVYGELFKRMTGIKIDKYYIVKLSKKDGTYELHEVLEPRRALAAAKGVFKAYDWFKNDRDKLKKIRTWSTK